MSYFESRPSKSTRAISMILSPFHAGDKVTIVGVVFVWEMFQIAEISAPKYTHVLRKTATHTVGLSYAALQLEITSIHKTCLTMFLYLRTGPISINLYTASRDIRYSVSYMKWLRGVALREPSIKIYASDLHDSFTIWRREFVDKRWHGFCMKTVSNCWDFCTQIYTSAEENCHTYSRPLLRSS